MSKNLFIILMNRLSNMYCVYDDAVAADIELLIMNISQELSNSPKHLYEIWTAYNWREKQKEFALEGQNIKNWEDVYNYLISKKI